jgi:V/A-type H+-transporting ATPase subunit I
MSQFTLLTFDNYKNLLLKELQKTGVVHFKNLPQAEVEDFSALDRFSSNEHISRAETELSEINFALTKLAPYIDKTVTRTPQKPLTYEEFNTFSDSYDYGDVYKSIKTLDEKIKNLKSEKNKLKADNDAFSAWEKLDIPPNELNASKVAKFIFGTFPRRNAELFTETITSVIPCAYVELLDDSREDITCCMIVPAEFLDECMSAAKQQGFTKLNLTADKTPMEIISQNVKRMETIDKEITVSENDIRSFISHYQNLKITQDYFSTLLTRHKACENFLKTKEVVLIAGWYADDDSGFFLDAVSKICGDNYYLEAESVDKDSEEVPIKLKNNKFIWAFEGVTEMFALPRYNDIDPTPFLAPFYLLFFACMFGDAGYGIVMTVICAFILVKLNLKKKTRRFFSFFMYLGMGTIVMGSLYGSMFGAQFIEPVVDLDDPMFVLILSIGLGVLHIIVGLCVKGYVCLRDKRMMDFFADSFLWIITVVSIVGLLVSMMVEDFSEYTSICLYIFAGCVVGLLLTQGRSSPSLGGKIGNGIFGVYGITGYIGDFVSYARLMALALAGSYIAFSFNLMGKLVLGIEDMSDIGSVSNYIRFLPAIIIVVAGALLNFGLGALGSYVHSCRLQYVEFFGKFYDGGGIPFEPFEIKNNFVDINEE